MKDKGLIFEFNIQRLIHFEALLYSLTHEYKIYILLTGNIEKINTPTKQAYEKLLCNKNIQILSFPYSIFYKEEIFSFFLKRISSSLSQIILFFLYLAYYKFEYSFFKKQIFAHNIKAVFIPDDRLWRKGVGLLKAAKDSKIKIILPFLYTTQKHSTVLFHKDPKYYLKAKSSLFQNYVFSKMKKLENQISQKHFFYPCPILYAQHKFKTLSQNPWSLGYGTADIVCLESKLSLQRLEKEIGPNSKYRVIGDITYDLLYKSNLNKDIMKKKYQQKNKKIIILSVAAFYETGLFSLKESKDKIEFLLTNILELEATILISLHPLILKSTYQYLEEKYQCTILNEPLFEILPIADLFVNSVSSTINWAILCGINSCILTNLYDDSGLHTFYQQFDSVFNTNKNEDFNHTLHKSFNTNINFTDDWEKLSRDLVFTGTTLKRYKELLNE